MIAKGQKDVRAVALLVVLCGLLLGGLAFGISPKPWLSGATQVGFREFAEPRVIGRSIKADHQRRHKLRELDTRFRQGVAMLHAGQFEFAVTAFERVLAIDPQVPEAHVNRGYALLGLEDHRAALTSFDRAIALNERQLNAYYGMALALEGLSNYAGAAAALQTFLHLAPKDDRFYEQARARFALVQKRLTEQRSAPAPSPSPAQNTQEMPNGNAR